MLATVKRLTWNVLRAPYWAAQLPTGAKSFMDNPILGSPTLNGWGLHVRRMGLAHRLAQSRRNRLARLVSPEDRRSFDQNGFVLKPDFLAADLFGRLLEEVQAYRGTVRETVQGNAVTRRIALDPPTLAQIPALRTTLGQPDLRGLLRYVFSYDAEPIFYLQTILSQSRSGPDDPQCDLHADTFHPTVKAWLFLTDVPEDEGPFTYVPGSHCLTPARLAWERKRSLAMGSDPDRLSRRGSLRVQADELSSLGLPPPRALAVKANTLVVADTCGFHARSPSARPTRRVELWASGRRNPFLPWVGLDVSSIEAIGQRRMAAFWSARDMVERLGGRPNFWRPREGVSAFDTDVPTS